MTKRRGPSTAEEERDEINRIIMDKLVPGIFKQEGVEIRAVRRH